MVVRLPYCVLIYLALISTLSTSFGQTTYYVANSGDDNNTGRSSNDPFKTVDKIGSLSLQPGDQVLFQRNDIFRGSLQIHQSGSSDKPIVIDAYGSGNKPVLAGSVPISNWTNVGNNVWQANCPSCGNQVTGLYRNASALPLGRYPNLSDANRGYLTIQSHNGKTQLTSQQGLSTNWTGGEAVVRPYQWVMDRAPITSQNGNTLSLDNNSIYELSDGWGFFIQNHPATLDQFGEWYYNPADKTIRLYDEREDPNSQLLTATVFSNAVNLTNVSFVTVRNIKITETLTTGLAVNGSSNLTISANDITNSGINAIDLSGSGSNILLENNLIEDVNNNGLYVEQYQNLTVRGNTIRRVGLVPGRGKSGDSGSYSGIHSLSTANSLVENNTLDNIGYNGISVVSNATIRNNVVSNFCLTKSDGSGIYSWNNNRSNPGGLHIVSNIVFNGIGAPEGTSGGVYAGANGIFLDDCSENSEIINNTSFNSTGKGFLLRGTSNITLTGNTSFNNGEEQLRLGYNDNCTFRNNTIQNNIFFSKLASQLVVDYESKANDLNQYGNFDRNYYVSPFQDVFKIQAVYNPGSGLTGKVLTLAEWQTQWNQDRNSFNSPITYKKEIVTQTGASVVNNSFDGNIDGWGVWSPYGNGRVDWDNSNRLNGGSLQLSFASASNRGDGYLLATINIGSVTKGKTYQLLFDGIASANGKRVEIFPRQLSVSYSDLAARASYVLTTGRQAYEATFTATADESNAILVIRVDEDGQTAWFDNIRLNEATLAAVNPDDYIKLVYNTTFQDKVESLNGVYRDAKNTVYTNQVTVAPFSSVVLLKEINTTPPPTTQLRNPENPANAVGGLDYQYYEGYWQNLPDFNSLTAAKTGTASVVDLSVRGRGNDYGLRFTGYISVPADGVYTFYTTSDDGSKLYIGTTEVVSNDGQHADQERSGTIGLKAGIHAFSVVYFQGSGGQSLTASYSGPTMGKQVIPASAYYRAPSTSAPNYGSSIYLSDLNWTSATSGYGPVEKDRSNGEADAGDGRTITLNGVTYAKGLGVHASSSISYNLGGQYASFTTDMGLDDEMSNSGCGRVEFQIYLDNVLVYSSGTMNADTPTKSVTLDVTGKQTLMLVVTDGGDGFYCDHADWAGARLTSLGSPRKAAHVDTETDSPLSLQVYPIPAQEHIWIRYVAETAGTATVQLTNTAAQTVRQTLHPVVAGENLIKLEVSQFSRGSYVLILIQGQRRQSRKVIISD